LADLEFGNELLSRAAFAGGDARRQKLHNYLEKLREFLCQKLSPFKIASSFWNEVHCDRHTSRQSIVPHGEFIEPCLQAVEVVGEVAQTESGLI
jgi:hypothetical protein